MEGRKLLMVVLVWGMMMMMIGGESSGSFKDCYVKCYLFCVVDPAQTICSCTTHCFKDCIFPLVSSLVDDRVSHRPPRNKYPHFCTLGCASSFCSNISTKLHPNGERVQRCVGSCSKKCTTNF